MQLSERPPVVVLGTSTFTIRCAAAFMESGWEVRALISMPTGTQPLNSADLSTFAADQGIPHHEIEELNSERGVELVLQYRPDYVFSSWPKILTRSILQTPRFGCIGTHPADLPFNRGRHPLHWLIALGIQESSLTFFRMDEGVDTGPILVRRPFRIEDDDTIADVVEKVNQCGHDGTRELCSELRRDPLNAGRFQNHDVANYWRKRTPHDLMLDPRMSVGMILRTVRSFAPPYHCAKLVFEQTVLRVHRAAAVTHPVSESDIERMEHGKVIAVSDRSVTFKADDGLVRLECLEDIPSALRAARYIHPPSKYLVQWPEALETAPTS